MIDKVFEVRIILGNEAIETLEDVVRALHWVAARLEAENKGGRILDQNGNSVGTFGFTYADGVPPKEEK